MSSTRSRIDSSRSRHGLHGLARLLARGAAHVVDAAGRRPDVVLLVDADLHVGQRAVGRVGDVGQRVDERASGALERLDAGDGPLGHHAVEHASAEAAEARADREAVAPGRGRAEHLLRAPEPRRRRVARVAAPVRGEQLGEADHRAPLVAPEPCLVEALDGAAEACASVLDVARRRGEAGGLELEGGHEAQRRRVLHDRRAPPRAPWWAADMSPRLASDDRAFEGQLGGDVGALVRIERIVGRRRRAPAGLRGSARREACAPRLHQPRPRRELGGQATGRISRACARRAAAVRVVVTRQRGGGEGDLDARELARVPGAGGLAAGDHEQSVGLVVARAREQHGGEPSGARLDARSSEPRGERPQSSRIQRSAHAERALPAGGSKTASSQEYNF